jgi:hypothetical protein
MDSVAAARDAPVLSLRWGGILKARIPVQRDNNLPTVTKGDVKHAFCDLHIGDTFVSPKHEDAHAMPPQVPQRSSRLHRLNSISKSCTRNSFSLKDRKNSGILIRAPIAT